ncbi:MAG: glycosyltransferase family 39 protein [Acidobacteria bacterium]|nr:glycosyltransferase family 39 protein [Acidobacteriota bacterium]
MKAVLYILLGTGLTFGASYSLGALLLARLRLRLHREEQRFFAFIAGSACLSSIIFFLNVAGLARKWVFVTLSAAAIAAGVWKRVWRSGAQPLPALPKFWRWSFWAIFTVFTWLYLSQAMAPESSADGVSYHVALAARYLREHRFPGITTNIYANLSEGVEMLFEFAFAFGRNSAAAMVEFLFLLSLPFGILSFARRAGRPVAGVVAALLAYLSPVVARSGTVAYNDAAGAVVVFAMFYAIQLWREQQDDRWLAVAGMLAGFGYGVKYTLGIGCVYAFGVVAWTCWRRRKPMLRPAAVLTLCATAWVAPWMVKNAVTVGNPVSPFANRLFPNPYVSVAFEDDYTSYLRKYDNVTPRQIPWEVAVHGERLAGLLGPVFLLAPLALVALRWPLGRELLLAAAVFLLPYPNNIGCRFLMPALPFVALAMAMAAEVWAPVAALLLAAHAVLSWPPVTARYTGQYAWRITQPAWEAALRKVPEDQYLRGALQDYDIGVAIEQNVPPGERILSASLANQSYQRREVLAPYQSTFAAMMYDTLLRATQDDMKAEARNTFRFPAATVRRLRIALSAQTVLAWTIGEIRVYEGEREVARDALWRLRASANPWYVQKAFDNSLVTMWSSDVRGAAGMFIDIDFGRPVKVDRVAVYEPRTLTDAMMRIEGDGRLLSKDWDQEMVPLPPRMRRAATEELKVNGVGWLVFRDGEFKADDLLTRYAQWGVKQVAERNGYRLWRIE